MNDHHFMLTYSVHPYIEEDEEHQKGVAILINAINELASVEDLEKRPEFFHHIDSHFTAWRKAVNLDSTIVGIISLPSDTSPFPLKDIAKKDIELLLYEVMSTNDLDDKTIIHYSLMLDGLGDAIEFSV